MYVYRFDQNPRTTEAFTFSVALSVQPKNDLPHPHVVTAPGAHRSAFSNYVKKKYKNSDGKTDTTVGHYYLTVISTRNPLSTAVSPLRASCALARHPRPCRTHDAAAAAVRALRVLVRVLC